MTRLRAALILSFAAALLALLFAGCTYDSTNLSGVRCDEEGMVDGSRTCIDGYWTEEHSSGDLDDVGPDDAGDGDADCIPESAAELQAQCAAQNYQCGELLVVDRCGDAHTLECGTCDEDEVCHPEDFECTTCPAQSNRRLCEENNLDCGEHLLIDDCDEEREVNCGDCNPEPVTEVLSEEPFACCNNGQLCTSCVDVRVTTTTCDPDTFQCESVSQGRTDASECDACQEQCSYTSDCQTQANVCSESGTRNRNCQAFTCSAQGGNGASCVADGTPSQSAVACSTGVIDGDSCPLTDASCAQGVCSSEQCVEPCTGDDNSCGCTAGNCDDCTTLGPNGDGEEWFTEEVPVCQGTGSNTKRCVQVVATRHIWVCTSNGEGCALVEDPAGTPTTETPVCTTKTADNCPAANQCDASSGAACCGADAATCVSTVAEVEALNN